MRGAQKSSSLSALLLSSGGRWRPESRMIYEWDSISFLFALPCILERLERRRSQNCRKKFYIYRNTFDRKTTIGSPLVGNGTELSALKGEKSLTKLTARQPFLRTVPQESPPARHHFPHLLYLALISPRSTLPVKGLKISILNKGRFLRIQRK